MGAPLTCRPVCLKQLDAFILAGGQGRRLNRDKVHLELPNGRVLANLIDLCGDLFRTVTLVVDRAQRIHNPPAGVRIMADVIPGSGPLGGLLTGLGVASSRTSFVTACDLPFLNREIIHFVARRMADQDVLVPARGDAIEPLVGFYAKTCSDAIRRSIERGDLRVRGFWPEVRTEVVDLAGSFRPGDLDTWLLNVNTRRELQIAEAVASSGTWE